MTQSTAEQWIVNVNLKPGVSTRQLEEAPLLIEERENGGEIHSIIEPGRVNRDAHVQ